MTRATPLSIGYFGKLPSRGDFVKASDNLALIDVLDEWLSQAMDMLNSDPRWKITYDAVAPLHFAFIGPRRRRAVAGHIIASSDLSKRRYPFMMMSAMEIDEPAAFVPNAPLVLSRLWSRFESLTAGVLAEADPTAALQDIAASTIEIDLRNAAYDAAFADFLDLQTVGALDAMLAQSGAAVSVRQVLLALGMLMQPVMASGSSRLEKSLVLPLPSDPMYRNLVGAFWMHVIAPFLVRADFELSLFVTRIRERPSLVLGFSGASAVTLQAIMDMHAAQEQHIVFDDLSWVEEQVDSDYAVKKVSTYLAQPNLSLKSAYDSLCAAFIGS
jgi:type VI secretion system protein ImpM